MANLYYLDSLELQDCEPGATITVTGDEARHAVRAARLRVGEKTLVGNARGLTASGEVVRADRDRFTVRVEQATVEPKPRLSLVLVQALAKGDRDERAVEQATEFGVQAIIPWQASRSVSRWDGPGGSEKARKGVAKWARIAREAAKQSMRAHAPEVLSLTGTSQLGEIAYTSGSELLVLHPLGKQSLSSWATSEALSETKRAYLVVGPEGGLSEEELAALESAGARALTVGQTVLRTSSAGPAALAVLNVALGRW